MPGYGMPEQRLKFEHHAVPPIEMDNVTDIITRLDQPGVDFIYLKPNARLLELIETAKGKKGHY
jgi:hypothetical protein